MYKIDKGIPIPDSIHGGGAREKYPFKLMEIGDSFFIPCEEDDKHKVQSNLSNPTRKIPNMKFTTKFVKEGESTGIRVWRIQ